MKIGLVLEGGAMRGMFTTGVLDVFMENNIEVDGVIAVSAGALFGVNYVSKQIGRAIRYNKKFNQDKNYLGIIPLIKEGNIINTEYAYHRVPFELDIFDDETYKNSPIPFIAVATEVKTGNPEYIPLKSVYQQMDVLRASGSMPFVSQPVKLGDKYYLDGGISDSIPYQWMLDHGYDKVIVILTRDINYVKKPMKSFFKYFIHKYPAIQERL
ncbi:MAG: patatin family protein, partial [Erysipelotrichaceae bacterium]|nr:patatin family protein [Erysipelotrichaceae bacterium]